MKAAAPEVHALSPMTVIRRSLKRFVRYWLREPSAIGDVVRSVYRMYHRLIVAYYAWANTRKHEGVVAVDPFEILSADPAKITHWVSGVRGVPRTSWRRLGSIEGGDWDRRLGEFAALESHIGLCEHFLEGKPWPETLLFRTVVARLATGTVEWGCLTPDQFATRCAEIDVLWSTMRESGYKSQKELSASGRENDPISHVQLDSKLREVDEIAACIGRTGEILLADGQHRLSLAKILQLPAIPVRVVVRHTEWQQLRERLAEFVRMDLGGNLPHAVPHPDLNWQPSRFRSSEWFELLRANTGYTGGTLIEVDAGISGYFASRFEQLGFQCAALEYDSTKAVWLNQVRDANRDRFEIIRSPEQARARKFDVVLWVGIVADGAESFEQRCREVTSLVGSELWVTHATKESAELGGAPRSPHETGKLLMERLGFAAYSVVECPFDNRYALVRATTSVTSVDSVGVSAERRRGQRLLLRELPSAYASSRDDGPRAHLIGDAALAQPGPDEPRLKVLISAYACSPNRGSEPGIGWNNALEAARCNEVWVITRRDFREAIEAELKRNPQPHMHFEYLQLPKWTRFLGVPLAYYLWQIGIYFVARRLHKAQRFDVAHHVSYVRSWSPSLLTLLPIPLIWGPVGGGETVPPSFRRGLSLRGRLEELQRDVAGWLSSFDPLLRYTAQKSAIVIANSVNTARRVRQLGARRVEIMGESGLDEMALDPAGHELDFDNTPVRFASLTRLVYWKGLHLGLEAFARLNDPGAEYWIIGDGPEELRLRALAERLGVGDRVLFRKGLSREEWMAALRQIDALLHPSICNTGNAITLEAMAAGRPVICLDIGGVSMQVTGDTGFKISASDPQEAVIGLEKVMRSVIVDRQRAAAMGRKARSRAKSCFSWRLRGELMQSYYQKAAGSRTRAGVQTPEVAKPAHTGSPEAAHRLDRRKRADRLARAP